MGYLIAIAGVTAPRVLRWWVILPAMFVAGSIERLAPALLIAAVGGVVAELLWWSHVSTHLTWVSLLGSVLAALVDLLAWRIGFWVSRWWKRRKASAAR